MQRAEDEIRARGDGPHREGPGRAGIRPGERRLQAGARSRSRWHGPGFRQRAAPGRARSRSGRNSFAEAGRIEHRRDRAAAAAGQARMLAEAGFAVRSFDLAGSQFSAQRVFTIEDYDGHRIPAADAAFDIVFSSNVLEHIPTCARSRPELHRVLKPDGIAVHLPADGVVAPVDAARALSLAGEGGRGGVPSNERRPSIGRRASRCPGGGPAQQDAADLPHSPFAAPRRGRQHLLRNLALQPASLDTAVRGDRLACRLARHQRAVLYGLQRTRLAALPRRRAGA